MSDEADRIAKNIADLSARVAARSAEQQRLNAQIEARFGRTRSGLASPSSPSAPEGQRTGNPAQSVAPPASGQRASAPSRGQHPTVAPAVPPAVRRPPNTGRRSITSCHCRRPARFVCAECGGGMCEQRTCYAVIAGGATLCSECFYCACCANPRVTRCTTCANPICGAHINTENGQSLCRWCSTAGYAAALRSAGNDPLLAGCVTVNYNRPVSPVPNVGNLWVRFCQQHGILPRPNEQIRLACYELARSANIGEWDYTSDSEGYSGRWEWRPSSPLLVASDGSLWATGTFKKRGRRTMLRIDESAINWQQFWSHAWSHAVTYSWLTGDRNPAMLKVHVESPPGQVRQGQGRRKA